MASFESRTKTITRYEWAVPVGPYGTDYEELGKAYAQAARKAEDLPQDVVAVTVHVGDDEIIFRVEGEKLERPTPQYRDESGTTQIMGLPVIPRTGGPGSPQGAV